MDLVNQQKTNKGITGECGVEKFIFQIISDF
jgi:hypothetical protein